MPHFCEVDYLLLVDHPAHFQPWKVEAIKKGRPYNYFIVDLAWLAYLDKTICVPVQLGDTRGDLRHLDNCQLMFSNVPFSYNSPFIAACLAARMGAKRINLFGIDFRSDSAQDHREISDKNVEHWFKLYMALSAMDIKVYTTPESKLSTQIPINPDLKP